MKFIFALFLIICLQNFVLSLFNVNNLNVSSTPINLIDVTNLNITKNSIFTYPNATETTEIFKLLHATKDFLLIGAKNYILNITNKALNEYSVNKIKLGIEEFNSDCDPDQSECNNYVTAFIQLDSSNYIICGSITPFRCILSNQSLQSDSDWNVSKRIVFYSPNKASSNYVAIKSNNVVTHLVSYINYDKSLRESIYEINGQFNDPESLIDIVMKRQNVYVHETVNKIFTFENSLESYDDNLLGKTVIRSYKTEISHVCKNEIQSMSKVGQRTFNEQFLTYFRVDIYCIMKTSEFFKRLLQIAFVSDPVEIIYEGQPKKFIYVVFNSGVGEIVMTSICLYDYDDIVNAFSMQTGTSTSDTLLTPSTDSSSNTNIGQKKSIYDCELVNTKSKSQLREIKRNFNQNNNSVQDIGSIFYKINDFQIKTFFISSSDNEINYVEPKLIDEMSNTAATVIYAGTDQGSLLRILHEFKNSLNKFDSSLIEHHTVVVDEIKLFKEPKEIKNIKLLNTQNGGKRMIIITNNEIKSISLNFCEYRHQSCSQCTELNKNLIYKTRCFWQNNSCVSESELKNDIEKIDKVEMCIIRQNENTLHKQNIEEKPFLNDDLLLYVFIVIILSLIGIACGMFFGCIAARKHLFDKQLYKKTKTLQTKFILNDLDNIKNFMNNGLNDKDPLAHRHIIANLDNLSDYLKLTLDKKNRPFSIINPLSDTTHITNHNEYFMQTSTIDTTPSRSFENIQTSPTLSSNSNAITNDNFNSRASSIKSIDRSMDDDETTKSIKRDASCESSRNTNTNASIGLSKHSRYVNKRPSTCFTVQNHYTSIKPVEAVKTTFTGRTSSTSSNNSSSNTSGIITNFTNSDTYIFQQESSSDTTLKLPDENHSYTYEEPQTHHQDILRNYNDENQTFYLTNMLHNYPHKTTIRNKLCDYQPRISFNSKNSTFVESDNASFIRAKQAQLNILKNFLNDETAKNSYV